MSSAEEELFRRLQEGLPAAEAPELLRKMEEERARSKAPKQNPHKLNDEHAQKLSDLWFSQREVATIEQKNKVGLTYISRVLGLGYIVAHRFAKGNYEAYHQVGLKQSAIPISADVSGFWKAIQKIFPEVYTNDDIRYLSNKGGVGGVLHFMFQLETPLVEQSPILRELAINAHAYK